MDTVSHLPFNTLFLVLWIAAVVAGAAVVPVAYAAGFLAYPSSLSKIKTNKTKPAQPRSNQHHPYFKNMIVVTTALGIHIAVLLYGNGSMSITSI
jgi:hypothetical protein